MDAVLLHLIIGSCEKWSFVYSISHSSFFRKIVDRTLSLCYNCINQINTVKTLLCGKEVLILIILDYRDRRPIYEQIVERFQELMMSGGLEQDAQLPSVRSLAMDLSINPNTIQRAYAELERQGYIYSVKGKGSFVADNSVLKDGRKQALLKKQEETALEAWRFDVDREALKDIIDRIYDRGGMSDD